MLLSVKNLSKKIGDKEILKNISFDVKAGECLALIGPNGAGKTSLFKHLLGQMQASSGSIRISNKEVSDISLKEEIAILGQENSVPKKLKVRELIEFCQTIYKNHLSLAEIDAILNFSSEQKNQLVSKLSGGQKRFLFFILSLIGKPKILFLDEPTSAMDTETRIRFWEIVNDLKSKGMTIIYSSHYIEEVEHTAERILVLNKGSLIKDTSPYALKSEDLEKEFTIPSKYLPLIKEIEFIKNLEIKKDNLVFNTKNADEVWNILKNSCSLNEIEIQNRTLLTAIFENTKEGK
ncbi:ABC transporter ATP-binding protein [Gemella sp. zg-1178]|uniref:ABC transporter ATP-binding protein n=1 Tax=Gemella sp. zg-1178 TaxID=2840372 RepID=UPI001C05858F|nr:ABC transporter ATP-binding protein [Gemella sp. zg-1178]MBU0278167.1 ABC transporter ATP-binding protein [Gemella sp. zg-1178]